MKVINCKFSKKQIDMLEGIMEFATGQELFDGKEKLIAEGLWEYLRYLNLKGGKI